MDLRWGDCLELMDDLPENSVDLLFADLPYNQTACKWDCLIDLPEFWRKVNYVCKPDAPMIFTTTAKFGNLLINSNPKNFRYDLVWVKSCPVGFLNAKKMPMRKHELIYVFYNKIPIIYTENIARHHKHKFKDAEPKKNIVIKETTDVYGGTGVYAKADHASSKNYIGYGKNNDFTIYEPPLPNTIIKEGCYGDVPPNSEAKYGQNCAVTYDPKLPTTIIKEEENTIIKTELNQECKSVLYGNLKRDKIAAPRYEPMLPTSIVEAGSVRGKHSTQKPVSLMEWILKYYSREGDIVLDPTMGSGSMGQACKNMDRFFIGFEKDEKIFSIAMERLTD